MWTGRDIVDELIEFKKRVDESPVHKSKLYARSDLEEKIFKEIYPEIEVIRLTYYKEGKDAKTTTD